MRTSQGPIRRLAVVLAIAAATTSCDQSAKSIIFDRLADSGPTRHLGGLLRLDLVLNRGGFLGLGETLAPAVRWWVFTLGVGIALSTVIYIAVSRRLDAQHLIGFGLILGGGLSNLLDRIFLSGAVRDFAILGIGPLRTGVFNVADMALLLGTGCLLLASSSKSSRPNEGDGRPQRVAPTVVPRRGGALSPARHRRRTRRP